MPTNLVKTIAVQTENRILGRKNTILKKPDPGTFLYRKYETRTLNGNVIKSIKKVKKVFLKAILMSYEGDLSSVNNRLKLSNETNPFESRNAIKIESIFAYT